MLERQAAFFPGLKSIATLIEAVINTEDCFSLFTAPSPAFQLVLNCLEKELHNGLQRQAYNTWSCITKSLSRVEGKSQACHAMGELKCNAGDVDIATWNSRNVTSGET